MGSIQVSGLAWKLPSGEVLFDDVSFSVGSADRVALVGANGVGKTSLLRIVVGEQAATAGTVSVNGRLGVMHQLVGLGNGPEGAPGTVRTLLGSIAPERAAGPTIVGSHTPRGSPPT